MSKYGIGQPVLRFEDPRLLRGQGRYINDVNLDYVPLNTPGAGENVDVILVAVKKEMINDYTSVISQTGKVAVIDGTTGQATTTILPPPGSAVASGPLIPSGESVGLLLLDDGSGTTVPLNPKAPSKKN